MGGFGNFIKELINDVQIPEAQKDSPLGRFVLRLKAHKMTLEDESKFDSVPTTQNISRVAGLMVGSFGGLRLSKRFRFKVVGKVLGVGGCGLFGFTVGSTVGLILNARAVLSSSYAPVIADWMDYEKELRKGAPYKNISESALKEWTDLNSRLLFLIRINRSCG